MNVQESDVAIIMDMEKRITEPVVWKKDSEHPYTFNFFASIECDFPGKIYIKGSANQRINKYSFSIHLNKVRIKGLDIGKTHKNTCPYHPKYPKRVGRKHKHTWKDCCNCGFAYEPDDITSNAPMSQVFREFLIECNIEYNEPFQEPPEIEIGLWEHELLGS